MRNRQKEGTKRNEREKREERERRVRGRCSPVSRFMQECIHPYPREPFETPYSTQTTTTTTTATTMGYLKRRKQEREL